MLKTEQAAIIQNANVNLINIRNLEINYFGGFFSSFGTQAAVIAGIMTNSISQTPGLHADCSILWVVVYWITSALTFVFAIHVLLGTTFLSVYGQGLALRGPVGSMVKALDGMVKEQENMVFSFSLMLFFLAWSLVGTYGIFMNFITAVICSVITLIGMYHWYLYALRLYNRFKFSPSYTWISDIRNDPNNLRRSLPDASLLPITIQGYLSIVDDEPKILQSKLKRRYFVLRTLHIDYYSDQRSFEINPLKPVNKRPIELQDYRVDLEETETEFKLFLMPEDANDNLKEWEFRCDTRDEMTEWVGALKEAIKLGYN